MSLHFIPKYLQNETYKCFMEVILRDQLTFLTQESIDRLINCLRSPTNKLFEGICSFGGNDYVLCVFDRNNCPASSTVDDYSTIELGDKVENYENVQENAQTFTNGSPFLDEFFSNKGYYYHTFRCKLPDSFDRKQFLNEQILWTANRIDEAKTSIMDDVYEHLYSYGDFGGLFCVWDGYKTVEIHTEWDIRHLSHQPFTGIMSNDYKPNMPDSTLYSGLERCWDVLSAQITQIIQKQSIMPIKLDKQLRSPESYRRLAWGKRNIKSEREFFDKKYSIPQIELYANTCRGRYVFKSPKPCLHKPALFNPCELRLSHYLSQIEKRISNANR